MLHQLRSNLSETFQSAYPVHHNMETDLLDVTNCLPGSADKSRVSILTLLNLSATFDMFDYSILLALLHNMFGISGKAFEWFSSSLSVQSVSINPEGRPGMSDVSPLSGISGLSFDSTLLVPLLFFCLILLPFVSDIFLPAGPFF